MVALKVSCLVITLFFLGMIEAIPTVESLFRHASNADVTSPTIIVKGQLNESSDSGEPLDSKTRFIEWDFTKNGDDYQIVQKIFSSSQMDGHSLLEIKSQNSIKWNKSGSSFNLDQQLFFAIHAYLLFNDARPMTTLLSAYNDDFLPNQKLINGEKLVYLKQRLEALQNKSSASPVGNRRTQQLSNQNLLVNNGSVKYELDESVQLKLKMSLRNVEGYFSNETHQLERLNWKLSSSPIEVNLKEYLLFDGSHYFPKYMVFHATNQKVYSLRFLSLEHKTPIHLVPMAGAQAKQGEVTAPFLLL